MDVGLRSTSGLTLRKGGESASLSEKLGLSSNTKKHTCFYAFATWPRCAAARFAAAWHGERRALSWRSAAGREGAKEPRLTVMLSSVCCPVLLPTAQNHRILRVGRGPCRPSSPTLL